MKVVEIAIKSRIDIMLDEHQLNRIATGSILGIALGKLAPGEEIKGATVRLLFPAHDLAWCRANGGSDSITLVEYAPRFLADGVLDLLRVGAMVEVVEVPWKESNP